jgi:adenylate cyclase
MAVLDRTEIIPWPDGKLLDLAVMFSDMAESTRYAEIHGSHAAWRKRRQHNRLLLPIIRSKHGSFVESAGDSLLAIFRNVNDAVACGVAMQRRLRKYNSTVPELRDEEIHVRIGIHFGKAIVLQRDAERIEVVGRAVNQASRVESGNGKKTDRIILSQQAYEQLEDGRFKTRRLGVIKPNGVAPMQLYRLLWT